MRSIALACALFLFGVLALAGIASAASAGDVVINEVYINPAQYFDNCEYIELYNRTSSAINLYHWVLTSVEYDQFCVNPTDGKPGEHHWMFPNGITIPAHGYIVVARDAVSNAEATDPGFTSSFGFAPNVEMYDASQVYEVDTGAVPNMICLNPDSYDDQIRLYPGTSDYGIKCGTSSKYEAVWLFADSARTNQIDAMEYYDPAYCVTDMCTGVNGVDNDSYQGIPDANISLGRDGSSTDTNRSNADFHPEARTPRAQNSLNVPPEMWTLSYSPCVPTSTDSVEVSVYAKDPDGIAWVKCWYSVSGGAFIQKLMSATPGDSLYKVKIPPQADGFQMKFYAEARDNNAVPATGSYPADAPAGAYCYSVGMREIYEVQYVEVGGDTSSYLGGAVNITGVVTAGLGVVAANSFVVQDGPGPWNGIFVFDPTNSVPAEEGDSVIISGKVQEYYNRTEVYMFVGCYNEVSSGNEEPYPVEVVALDLATGSPNAENYEGVLVKVNNATVTNDSLGYGEWEINDGSGACRVDDYSGYSYTPNTGDHLDAVQGILDYNYSDYKIEPRWTEDIIGPPMIFNLVYSPHAPRTGNAVTMSCVVKGVYPITSVKLFYSTNGGATFDSTGMTAQPAPNDTIYTCVIGPFTDGTTVDYYARATDNQPMSTRKPGGGTYDFYVGMRTIHDVQYVVAPQDSSPLAGQPVNVSGIVTAATGEFSDYYFFIENHYGGSNPEFKGVKVYDRTGTVDVARGDSVTVSGSVWENYFETEIAMFFPEAITVHSHGTPVPKPYSVMTASVPTGEKWEGVLVIANAANVTNADAGYGEWLITNGLAADTCRVGNLGNYSYVPHVPDNVTVAGPVMYAYSVYTIQPRNDADICEPGDAGVKDGDAIPARVSLLVKPNPMLDGSEVRFALPVAGQVSLKIYNVKGELVRTLVDARTDAGVYTIGWNGSNNHGNTVTSGIYFLKLETAAGSAATKVVVSK